MKKLLTLFFIAMPLIALAWCNNQHTYRVTFKDKWGCIRECFIKTQSYSSNWYASNWKETQEAGCKWAVFYFNDDELYKWNIHELERAGVKDMMLNIANNTLAHDGYITLAGIDTVQEMQDK